MKKRNLKEEKAERNKLYSKRFEKSWEEQKDAEKKGKRDKSSGGKWGAWCRIGGHPATCSCVYDG